MFCRAFASGSTLAASGLVGTVWHDSRCSDYTIDGGTFPEAIGESSRRPPSIPPVKRTGGKIEKESGGEDLGGFVSRRRRGFYAVPWQIVGFEPPRSGGWDSSYWLRVIGSRKGDENAKTPCMGFSTDHA